LIKGRSDKVRWEEKKWATRYDKEKDKILKREILYFPYEKWSLSISLISFLLFLSISLLLPYLTREGIRRVKYRKKRKEM